MGSGQRDGKHGGTLRPSAQTAENLPPYETCFCQRASSSPLPAGRFYRWDFPATPLEDDNANRDY
jgi:hypothetical protein